MASGTIHVSGGKDTALFGEPQFTEKNYIQNMYNINYEDMLISTSGGVKVIMYENQKTREVKRIFAFIASDNSVGRIYMSDAQGINDEVLFTIPAVSVQDIALAEREGILYFLIARDSTAVDFYRFDIESKTILSQEDFRGYTNVEHVAINIAKNGDLFIAYNSVLNSPTFDVHLRASYDLGISFDSPILITTGVEGRSNHDICLISNEKSEPILFHALVPENESFEASIRGYLGQYNTYGQLTFSTKYIDTALEAGTGKELRNPNICTGETLDDIYVVYTRMNTGSGKKDVIFTESAFGGAFYRTKDETGTNKTQIPLISETEDAEYPVVYYEDRGDDDDTVIVLFQQYSTVGGDGVRVQKILRPYKSYEWFLRDKDYGNIGSICPKVPIDYKNLVAIEPPVIYSIPSVSTVFKGSWFAYEQLQEYQLMNSKGKAVSVKQDNLYYVNDYVEHRYDTPYDETFTANTVIDQEGSNFKDKNSPRRITRTDCGIVATLIKGTVYGNLNDRIYLMLKDENTFGDNAMVVPLFVGKDFIPSVFTPDDYRICSFGNTVIIALSTQYGNNPTDKIMTLKIDDVRDLMDITETMCYNDKLVETYIYPDAKPLPSTQGILDFDIDCDEKGNVMIGVIAEDDSLAKKTTRVLYSKDGGDTFDMLPSPTDTVNGESYSRVDISSYGINQFSIIEVTTTGIEAHLLNETMDGWDSNVVQEIPFLDWTDVRGLSHCVKGNKINIAYIYGGNSDDKLINFIRGTMPDAHTLPSTYSERTDGILSPSYDQTLRDIYVQVDKSDNVHLVACNVRPDPSEIILYTRTGVDTWTKQTLVSGFYFSVAKYNNFTKPIVISRPVDNDDTLTMSGEWKNERDHDLIYPFTEAKSEYQMIATENGKPFSTDKDKKYTGFYKKKI